MHASSFLEETLCCLHFFCSLTTEQLFQQSLVIQVDVLSYSALPCGHTIAALSPSSISPIYNHT